MPSIKFTLRDSKHLRRLSSMHFGLNATPEGATVPDCEICMSPQNRFLCRAHWTPNEQLPYEVVVNPSLIADWNPVLWDRIDGGVNGWGDIFHFGEPSFPAGGSSSVLASWGDWVFPSNLRDHADVRTPGERVMPLVEWNDALASGSCEVEKEFPFDVSDSDTIGTTDGTAYTGDAPVNTLTLNGYWSGAADPGGLTPIGSNRRNADDGYFRRLAETVDGYSFAEQIVGKWKLKFDVISGNGTIILTLDYEYTMDVIEYGWYARYPFEDPDPVGDVTWDVRMWKKVWRGDASAPAYFFDADTEDCIFAKNGDDPDTRTWAEEIAVANEPKEIFEGEWNGQVTDPDFRTSLSDVVFDLDEDNFRTEWEEFFTRDTGSGHTINQWATFLSPPYAEPADDTTDATLQDPISCTRRDG